MNVRFLNHLRALCRKQHHSIETNCLKRKEEFLLQHAWDCSQTPWLTPPLLRSSFLCPKGHLDVLPFPALHTAESWGEPGLSTAPQMQQDTEVPGQGSWGMEWGLLFVVLNLSCVCFYTLATALGLEMTWEYPWCCITDHWLPQIPWHSAGSAARAAEQWDCTSWRTSCLTHTRLRKWSMAASAGRALPAHLCWASAMASATRALWTGFCQLWQENLLQKCQEKSTENISSCLGFVVFWLFFFLIGTPF